MKLLLVATVALLVVGVGCGPSSPEPIVSDPRSALISELTSKPPLPTPTFEGLKARADRVEYDELNQNGDKYKGSLAYFMGEVVTVDRVTIDGELSYIISQMHVTLTGRGDWAGEALVSYQKPNLKVGDFVEFTGSYQGLESVKMEDGSSQDIPRFIGATVVPLSEAP